MLLDRALRVVHANQAALDFFGTTRDRLKGADGVGALFGPAERGPADEVLTKVLAGTHWEGELPVAGRDEHAGRTHLFVTALYDDRARWTACCSSPRTPAAPAAARPAARRTAHPARPGHRRAAACDDVPAVTQIVIQHIADAAGATVASLSVPVDESTLRLVGLRGGRRCGHALADLPDAGTPPGTACCQRRAVVLSGRDDILGRYPDLETAPSGERSIVCLR